MSCTNTNISIFQGDTWNQSFTFTNDDDTPIDLSGCTEIKMTVRKRFDAAAIIEGNMTDGDITVTGADDNVVNFVNIAIPDDAAAGGYIFDIECTEGETKTTYGIFQMEIKRQVTT